MRIVYKEAHMNSMDAFDHAAANAKPDCPKCGGKGSFLYDHNHGTICDLCCKHDRGFWQLGKHHAEPGNWCCLAGCGMSWSFNPDEAH